MVLPTQLRDEVRAFARAKYPREACGLLIGTLDDDLVETSRIVQINNINSERPRDRYLLDPAEFVAADRAARVDGLEIVGVWHSHPNSLAVPSTTDLENAWAEYSYLIVSISSGGETDTRSWRLDGDHFVEEIIRSDDS